MDSVPDLTGSLRVVEALEAQPVAPSNGPRQWWKGPLDVEGLALGAVQAAATSLNALVGVPGRYSLASGATAAAFDSLGHLRVAGVKPEGFAPMSGFRRTSDGWIRLHANYPHHAARLTSALTVSTPQDVEHALLGMTSLTAEEAITANNGVAAAVRTRDEWIATPMYATASSGPWIRISSPPPSASESPQLSRWVPSAVPRHPLAGLKVLDLTRVIAGPTATRLLGALGADVLRIDPPQLPELRDVFIDSGFDKRSAEADLRDPAAMETVRLLIESADVVVTGYRDGGLDPFGLAPEALLLARPELVIVTLSAWDSGGPWNGRRGFDSLVQAACGIAERYGRTTDDGWQPGELPVQALDHATGYGLAAAAIALLAERLRSGRGGTGRLSLARTAEELFRLPAVASHGGSLPDPELRVMDSPYGRLRYVGPPIMADGVPLEYSKGPVRYGTSQLRWQ
ncbi:CoA transferase [Pseudarthrobacter sp. MDT3-28]|uniref:CoA transferase n=1 Tax=Pseudarthrobacter raffinosi TaxID=2953651 RepID=UPI00208FC946|nr:CoA transferase [Pseudarthrobacter sp. MDT3-28]MCO4236466.1 CoA transferase [Pseudarthrobacter sp. MDT3-28]